MATQTLHFENARFAQQLLNNDTQNLRALEQILGIKATTRDGWRKLEGPDEALEHAAERSAWEVSAPELKSKLDRGEVTLVDVREPHEWEIARIPGARLIPLGELPNRFAELPMDGDLVLHCHKGVRSMRALELLRDHAGFKRVRSLRGGIDAWSTEVDSTVPRY